MTRYKQLLTYIKVSKMWPVKLFIICYIILIYTVSTQVLKHREAPIHFSFLKIETAKVINIKFYKKKQSRVLKVLKFSLPHCSLHFVCLLNWILIFTESWIGHNLDYIKKFCLTAWTDFIREANQMKFWHKWKKNAKFTILTFNTEFQSVWSASVSCFLLYHL